MEVIVVIGRMMHRDYSALTSSLCNALAPLQLTTLTAALLITHTACFKRTALIDYAVALF
jgi:hypothetical protein